MNRSDTTDQTRGEPFPPPLTSLIRAEQVRLAYSHLPLALLANVVNALAVVAILWSRVPHVVPLVWLSAITLLSTARYMLAIRYRQQHELESVPAWEKRFSYSAIVAGMLWGVIPLIMFPAHAFAHQAMITIILVGMSAGASITQSSHRGVLQTYLILILAPMILRLALEGQPLTLMLSAMGALFLVMISAAAGMFHRNAIDSIRLGLEAQQREMALKQAKDQYRDLFEMANDAILIVDPEGRILNANPVAYTRLGYQREELLGINISRLLPPKFAAGIQARSKRIRELGSLSFEAEHIRKDGSLMPVEVNAQRIDYHGQEAVLSIARDITERKQAEDRLRQAQKMEAIGTLVGGIAHDFNNVLAGVTGNLFLAKQQTEHMPGVAEKLELSERLAFSASKMIQQLLTFARKGVVEIRPMDLSQFMQDANRLYELSIPSNIAYSSVFCEQKLPIRGDDTQLQQVIINLLNNARDAVAEVEDPRIALTLEPFEASPAFRRRHDTSSRRFACISIEDNGCGISEDIKARIFEPFFTTKAIGSGTGLGLAMAYGTITSHGGFIDVESTPKTGTTFRIYLPLQPKLELQPDVARSESPVIGQGETLLVVDDDPQIRTITRHILEALGYRVLTASDGMEAIRVFNRNANDIKLIIMDLVMPKLGGARAYEQLHRTHEDVRVIFITSHDLKQQLEIAPLQDEAIVLQKPWSATQLSQSIRTALDRTLH